MILMMWYHEEYKRLNYLFMKYPKNMGIEIIIFYNDLIIIRKEIKWVM